MLEIGHSKHSAGRQLEDAGITSGFSPRALSLPPPSQGAWPPDQLCATPHKRLPQGKDRGNSTLAPSNRGEIHLSIPAGFWPDFAYSSSSHSTQSPVHKRAVLERSMSGKGAGIQIVVQGNGEMSGSSNQGTASGARLESNSLSGVTPASYMPPVGGGGGSKSKFSRSPSIPRSPTITKNISMLALDEAEGHGHPFNDKKIEFHPLVPAVLVTTALLVWCIRSFPGYPFRGWLFPGDHAPRGGLEFLLILLLLCGCMALVRLAFPACTFSLRLPAHWKINLNLSLSLQGLSPLWTRGLHLFTSTPIHVPQFKPLPSSSKPGKGSGPDGIWQDHSVSAWRPGTTPGQSSGAPPSWRASSPVSSPASAGSPASIFEPASPHVHPPGPFTPKYSARVSGCGVHTYSNGDRYEGEFLDGRCAGSGVYVFALAGGRYEGAWAGGKYDGPGVETWARGSRYRGYYRGGLRHGLGAYRFFTGDTYTGNWARGQSHGLGRQTCADGSSYEGEFAWGAKHGVGKYNFRNGDIYAGEYFSDKMHGYGVYMFANGHRYEGAWHEGRKQGLGLYTFRSGETRSGYWHRGALETKSTPLQVSGPPIATTPGGGSVNHGRVMHAVQEARQAATRARALLSVEDRVSRAVEAANAAAVAARMAAVKAAQKGTTILSTDP